MKYVVLSFLIIKSAFAAYPTINIQHMHGDFLDDKGSASAEKAYYIIPNAAKISHKDITIEINKKKKNLVISDPNTTVELVFDFSFINVFKAFTFEELNISSNSKLFTIKSDILDLYVSPKRYHLEDIRFETDVRSLPIPDDEDITVVDGMLLNANLKVKKLEFKNFDDVVFDLLQKENPTILPEVKQVFAKGIFQKLPMIVRSINFDVKKNEFKGTAKIDSYINLWLRLNGSINIDKDAKIIDINIRKAKLGIFSVKRTLLDMARNLKLENITVKGNHIYINLEK
ncbi:MAG: hypothetical protein HON90_16035 [Halobacteriovoraceae bacterium]|nr:hypothetical protein [Halobacteriovoraceae bacterium]